jgi:hypothetical protein
LNEVMIDERRSKTSLAVCGNGGVLLSDVAAASVL